MPVALGDRFARAVAARDADALRSVLAPRVVFHALTPGRVWQSDDADAVVEDVILGTWFSEEHAIIRVLDVVCGKVGPVDHVGYRFEVRLPDGDYIVEQHAYFNTEEGRISRLHILCSGFVHDDRSVEPVDRPAFQSPCPAATL